MNTSQTLWTTQPTCLWPPLAGRATWTPFKDHLIFPFFLSFYLSFTFTFIRMYIMLLLLLLLLLHLSYFISASSPLSSHLPFFYTPSCAYAFLQLFQVVFLRGPCSKGVQNQMTHHPMFSQFFFLTFLPCSNFNSYLPQHPYTWLLIWIYIYKQLLKKVTINKFKKKKLQKIKGEDVKGGAIYHENVGPLS